VRTLIECHLDLDLKAMISEALTLQPAGKEDARDALAEELYAFITERLRRYFLDQDSDLATETLEAVMVRQPASLVDFDRRLAAVQTFARLEQAESLAAANKRIANILRKAGDPEGLTVKKKLFEHDAERLLASALTSAREKVAPLLATRSYAESLNELADLKEPIDQFFDAVMVMADNEAVKNNRLALLSEIRALFLGVADISRLSLG
jgi:glycyl-tRNA synthetase beta chain